MGSILPAPYDSLPLPLQETLQRSHIEFEKGWKGISLADYLEDRKKVGILDVVKAVYERCKVFAGLWGHIDCVIGGWTYPGGNNISQGFNFNCSNPDVLITLLKASNNFCQDGANCHGPRDTFRELIKSGPGLHVCVVQKDSRETHKHDIHIDKHQTVCTKQEDGFCDYTYLNEQMYDHMKDVVPWWIGERMKELGKTMEKYPPPRGSKL